MTDRDRVLAAIPDAHPVRKYARWAIFADRQRISGLCVSENRAWASALRRLGQRAAQPTAHSQDADTGGT